MDLTEFGEDWVNIILDVDLALEKIKLKDSSMFYLWCVKEENGTRKCGSNYCSSNDEGFISAFIDGFAHNKVLIPLITTAIAHYIKNYEDKDKAKDYLNAIYSILKPVQNELNNS